MNSERRLHENEVIGIYYLLSLGIVVITSVVWETKMQFFFPFSKWLPQMVSVTYPECTVTASTLNTPFLFKSFVSILSEV